tara:strand:- start:164259 stop:165965 length:1707 start_codon:yes stop_codon:yes gene_type:complete
MSTNRTPVQMGLDFARELKNMYAQQGGAGYKRNGVIEQGSSIAGESIITLMHYVPVAGDIQLIAATDMGNLYHFQSDGSWLEVYTGLDVAGKVRWAHYAGRLIICNGIDKVMSWDGSSISIIHEWVSETGASLTYVDASTFTVESNSELYPVGKELKISLGAGSFEEVTVQSTSQAGNVTTVMLNESVVTALLDGVEFKEYPPTFNYVYAAHDRLWGMGEGALKANSFSNSTDRTFVFYTNSSGDEMDWRDESGALQYINIADKMPVSDEVIAMAVKDGLSIFFGRNYIQIWSGYDPSESGDMSWNKTIPLGLVHGNLIAEMPNDVAFFTKFGVRTLTRVLQTEQLDIADLGSEVDSSIFKALQALTLNDESYRKAQSFRHDNQGWFAFKPSAETFVFQLSGTSTGWCTFDGAFSDMTASINTPDGRLYIAIGGQLYLYDESTFSDAGTPIQTKWWTPWLQANTGGKRWANKYIEVVTDQGNPLTISAKRFKSYNNSSYVESNVTVHKTEDYWDESEWDSAFWDYGSSAPEHVRDHFIADVLSYSVETNSTDGPLTVYGLKLFGIQEK